MYENIRARLLMVRIPETTVFYCKITAITSTCNILRFTVFPGLFSMCLVSV